MFDLLSKYACLVDICYKILESRHLKHNANAHLCISICKCYSMHNQYYNMHNQYFCIITLDKIHVLYSFWHIGKKQSASYSLLHSMWLVTVEILILLQIVFSSYFGNM